MTIPNFLDKLTGKKEIEQKTYLALVLSDYRVQAAVWKVAGKETEIVSLGTPVEWDGDIATTNELITAVDSTISSATEGLEIEPNEIIFGLADTWVEIGGIKNSKKDLIKAICKELSFKALGYVVISDTLVKYLKMQEGAPPTSLLMQVDARTATISLVELGIIKHTVSSKISNSISQDIANTLTQMPQSTALPSRFILVSAMENNSDLVQELTAYDWTANFNFLHTPKIEALPKDVEVHATAVAGGSEVATTLGFNTEPPLDTTTSTSIDDTLESITPSSSFLEGEDVGFVPSTPLAIQSTDDLTANYVSNETTDIIAEEDEVDDLPIKRNLPKLPSLRLPKLDISQLPSFHLPTFRLPRAPQFVFPLLITFSIVVILSLWYYFVPQANIIIKLQSKPITESIALTLSPKLTSMNLEERIIPANYSTEEIEGEETVSTTGKKTIGDPSTGTVTIYNRTSLPKTLPKGTTLSANSQKFTLDADIVVASKSAGVDYVDVPGKETVKITAVSFGAQGNLPSGTEFNIGSFQKDSFVAKNDQALSGGNSKEITVVSESDKTNLIKSLKQKIATDLNDRLKLDTTSGTSFYVLTDDTEIIHEEYNAKIGGEADQLTAKLTLKIGILTYSQQDIQDLLKTAIDQAIPQGYVRADITPEINLTNPTVSESSDVSATAEVSLFVSPSLDIAGLRAALRGKSTSLAQTTIQSLPSVVDQSISYSPNLPPRLMRIPFNDKRIQITTLPVK